MRWGGQEKGRENGGWGGELKKWIGRRRRADMFNALPPTKNPIARKRRVALSCMLGLIVKVCMKLDDDRRLRKKDLS